MKEIIIGIDPDSDKHGVAGYSGGKLTHLKCMTLREIIELIIPLNRDDIEFHIENVCASNKIFTSSIPGYRSMTKAKQEQSLQSRARKLGMCQQAQIELERELEHLNIPIVHHKISKNWKDSKTGKAHLERNTGWTGKSNEDTRSAAWFGYLGVQMNKGK